MSLNTITIPKLTSLTLLIYITVFCHVGHSQATWLDDPSLANYPGLNEQIDFEIDWTTVSLTMESADYDIDNFSTFFDSFASVSAQNIYIDFKLDQAFSYSQIDSLINSHNLYNQGVMSFAPAILIDGTLNRLTKQVVIKKQPNIQKQDLVSGVKRFDNNAVIEELPNDVFVVCLNNPILTINLLQELQSEDLIKWGQPDFRIQVHTFDSDPLFQDQYQLKNTGQNINGQQLVDGIDVNVEPAWALTKGSPFVSIAVIDDGVETHEDLVVYPSFLDFNMFTEPSETNYHGMACAGLISARHNQIGIKGIAPNSPIIGANIFKAGTSISDIASLFYTIANLNIAVVNNSWGFMSGDGEDQVFNPVCTENLHPAISEAISYAATSGRLGLGTVIVFASGNSDSADPSDHCITYPANHTDVISVGAITPLGNRALYSSIDENLDFVVPSSNADGSFGVVTLDKMGSKGLNSENYNFNFGGTSAAAPIVTGIAALLLSVNPSLSRLQVLQILIDNAVDLGDPGQDESFGHGLPDAFASVNRALELAACPDNLFMSGEAFLSEYSAKLSIKSSHTIKSMDVAYKSGDFIELQPNFEVMQGSTFATILETCN